MLYHSKQLNNGRWGIFIKDQLVATIGCSDTCQAIIQFLETRSSRQQIPAIIENHGVNRYFHDMRLRP